jgi:predicted dienelactone hydrolase
VVSRALALVVAVLVCSAIGVRARASDSSVGVRVLRLVDHSRVAVFRDGRRRPRTLVTYVRYPRSGHRPYPLVVFGHGFALLPGVYAKLLDSWARAGYVVAAPVFPVENEQAPGGPDESDLVNQPGDISFVISRLVAADADRRSWLYGLANRIAVAGHSDGAETAFGVAYERRYLDRRVRAAVISRAQCSRRTRSRPVSGARRCSRSRARPTRSTRPARPTPSSGRSRGRSSC